MEKFKNILTIFDTWKYKVCRITNWNGSVKDKKLMAWEWLSLKISLTWTLGQRSFQF